MAALLKAAGKAAGGPLWKVVAAEQTQLQGGSPAPSSSHRSAAGGEQRLWQITLPPPESTVWTSDPGLPPATHVRFCSLRHLSVLGSGGLG